MISSVSPKITTTSFKGAKESESKIDTLKQKGDDLNNSLEVVNGTLEKTTGLAGKTVVLGTGLWATITKPFKGIAEWAKQPESQEGIKKGMEIVKNNKKGFIIGASIAAAAITAAIIAKVVKKSKAEKAAQQEAQAAQQQAQAPAEPEHKLDIVSEAEA